jgi:hypothetical protein
MLHDIVKKYTSFYKLFEKKIEENLKLEKIEMDFLIFVIAYCKK